MNIILCAAFVLALLSFILTIFKDIGLTMVFNLDAFLIVVGGTTIALFIGFPMTRIRDTVNVIIATFSKQRDRESVIKDILGISKMYGKTDIRSLEQKLKQVDDDYLKMGINLLINNYSSGEIKNIMEREMMLKIISYNFSQNLLKTIARLTPSFGLVGTVISLIRIFKHFESVDTFAPMMSVALMSTFYGVIIANLFMMPICAKVKERTIISEVIMNITIEGVLAVKNMEHPLRLEERIRGFQEIEDLSLQGVNNSLEVSKGVGVI